MTATILLVGFYAVMAVSLTYAWFKGGGAERAAVILLLAFFVFRIVLRPFVPAEFHSVDPLAAAQDIIGFVGFVWIGLYARRFWPLLAAAFQMLSLGAHFARALEIEVDPWAYMLMKSVPTLMVFVTLFIGTASFQKRKRLAVTAISSTDLDSHSTGRFSITSSRSSQASPRKASSSSCSIGNRNTSARSIGRERGDR
ncbi:MAG: hypothetical protein ACK4NZ_04315 [Tsuneonella sp.]